MSRRREAGAVARPVRVLTVLPADPEQMRLGGIASFIRGFVKFAPDDFELGFLGLSATRQAGRWHEVELEGRAVRFFPVGGMPTTGRSRIPLALRFTLALLAHRRTFAPRHWIPAFHRPGTDLSFPGRDRPMWRAIHLTVEDLTTAGSESRWRSLGGPLARLERRSFERMARIYVVNRLAADAYRTRFPEVADRVRFLPNWADPTIFAPSDNGGRDRGRAGLRRELDLPVDAPVLLFAARLEGQKDPLLLARAFAALHRARPELRLVVAGDGTLREPMRAELSAAGALDASRFAGTVSRERLAKLMRASDALIITSAFETGPTVGLEALATGLPVVTTDVGEVAGLVAANGAGAVARSRSTDDLAAAIQATLAADAADTRSAALASAAPLLADRVLGALYDDNRLLAEQLAGRS
jgi:glycosyltransferase involved in cell wall biosynthesis